MRYRVDHITRYRYAHPVGHSSQVAHLRPREQVGQRCLAHRLVITPAPSQLREDQDYFGNPIARFEINTPHDSLVVHAHSEIELDRPAPELPASPAWDRVRQHFAGAQWGLGPDSLAGEYLFASPYVPALPELAEYATADFTPGRPVLEACAALMQRIHREFQFDPDATHVATPVAQVLAMRRGVCQDFAHLMIGSLRALGLPARYMSGYLLTEPPPGQPRLEGADASHAWVAVFVPESGWFEFDPTNDMLPSHGHLTFAWGRDFGDVSPLRGVILGGGTHEAEVAVTVTPIMTPAASAEGPKEA